MNFYQEFALVERRGLVSGPGLFGGHRLLQAPFSPEKEPHRSFSAAYPTEPREHLSSASNHRQRAVGAEGLLEGRRR